MQIKIYIPKTIEIPAEYLPALVRRAADSLSNNMEKISATRGHLVRQAVQDGLLRELDPFICEDGTVDIICDPDTEIPMQIADRTWTFSELLEMLNENIPCTVLSEIKSAEISH